MDEDIEWIDIWEEEPPRGEEILFVTGDGEVHLGELWGEEKLRKCKFHCFTRADDYECDATTPYDERVLLWFPIPTLPQDFQQDVDDED